jgi:hypothetical protein
MEKNRDLEKDIQNEIKMEPLSNAAKTGINSKVGRNLTKFMLVASLAGAGFFFNACTAGYIASEPAYVEYNRPPQPSNTHIWINGDWSYNRQSHGYVQKTGYWTQPSRNRTYVSGRWQSSPKGNYWVSGKWQRNHR